MSVKVQNIISISVGSVFDLAIWGIIGKLLAGQAKGITTFYIPEANLR